MEKPEIWLLVDSRGFGGIESHLAELAAGLREAGEMPRVLFLKDHGPHPLRVWLDARDLRWEALPGGLAALLRAMRACRPRLLHTHGYKSNILGRLAGRLTGVPVVCSFHSGEPQRGRLRLYDAVDRWSSFLAGRRIAVSPAIGERLPFRAEVIPNFVTIPAAAMPQAPPLTVAFVGRLAFEKGPDLFCELAASAPGPAYEVFGDGPMRTACETRSAGRRIRFHGARDGMAGAWGGIGLLAITSRGEGLPLAALEAMSHGVPVAAFALGGLPDLITHGRNGFLAPPGDVAAMAACVKNWAALAPSARAALGRMARARIEQGFERAAGVARIRAMYDALDGRQWPDDCSAGRRREGC